MQRQSRSELRQCQTQNHGADRSSSSSPPKAPYPDDRQLSGPLIAKDTGELLPLCPDPDRSEQRVNRLGDASPQTSAQGRAGKKEEIQSLDEATSPNSGSAFLNLPVELRIMVYQYVFEDGIDISSGYNLRSRSPGRPPPRDRSDASTYDAMYEIELEPTPLPLMLTCRDLHHELKQAIPREICLSVSGRDDFDAMKAWLGSSLGHVRFLHIGSTWLHGLDGRLLQLPNLNRLSWPDLDFNGNRGTNDRAIYVGAVVLRGVVEGVKMFLRRHYERHQVSRQNNSREKFLDKFQILPTFQRQQFQQDWENTLRWAINTYLDERSLPDVDRVISKFKTYARVRRGDA